MKKLIFVFIAFVFLTSCVNLTNNSENRIQNIETQFFEIPVGKLFSVTTKGGTTLKFKENTFLTDSKTVQIELQEILTRADLIKSGISTLTDDNEILETGGMVNLSTTSNAKINPDAPIIVGVPAKGLDTEMKKYEAVETDGKISWKLQDNLSLNAKEFSRIRKGKRLFKKNCANCHNMNLVDYATGPRLVNITKYRTTEWLRDFTRASQQMIEEGDSLATCNWIAWAPTVMINFIGLSDEEIDNIYFFIENKTAQLGMENATDNLADCNITAYNRMREVRMLQDSTMNAAYFLKMQKFTFLNIDRLLKLDSEFEIKTVSDFEINIKADYNEVGNTFILFTDHNTILPLYKFENHWSITNYKKMNLPLGEKVKIVAISDDRKRAGILEVEIKEENSYTLELKELSVPYDEFIENL